MSIDMSRLLFIVLCCSLLGLIASIDLQAANDKISKVMDNLNKANRQLMMYQFLMDEHMRSSGHSGVKRVRIVGQGDRPYYSSSHHNGRTLAAMHSHPEQRNVVGLGELIVVLNGVEFRTRHNDYLLKRRHMTNKTHGALEDIPMPDVPPEVTSLTNVASAATEMRNWFKAFLDQDFSVRDYRPYFKPVLCYLEGTWTHFSVNSHEEPFYTYLRELSGTDWSNLEDQIRFTSHTGAKDARDTFAFLPRMMMAIGENSTFVPAQWNYNILCHVLKDDLPLSKFRLVDDLKARMSMTDCPNGCSIEDYKLSRLARFQLEAENSTQYSLLDELMNQIPGHDNYPGFLNDSIYGDLVQPITPDTGSVTLNTAYYHRWYKTPSFDASGRQSRHRGFFDDNLFIAQTTDPKVVGMDIEDCSDGTCKTISQKWTYAIPLEIIYLNPLQSWNPYDLVDTDLAGIDITNGSTRNGFTGRSWVGFDNIHFYITPAHMMQKTDEASTGGDSGIFSRSFDSPTGEHACCSSGIWITTPNMKGNVGKVRQRYPIMPVYGEGSGEWKELAALTDILLEPSKYKNMFEENISKCIEYC